MPRINRVLRRSPRLAEGCVSLVNLLEGTADTGGEGELKALLKGAEQLVEHGQEQLLHLGAGVGVEQKGSNAVVGKLNSIDMSQGLEIILSAVQNAVFQHRLHLWTVFGAEGTVVVHQYTQDGKDRLVQHNACPIHLL